MKFILVLFVYVSLCFNCYADENNAFVESVLKLEIGKEIPDNFLIKYLDRKPMESFRTYLESIHIVDGNYVITFEESFGVGDRSYSAVFKRDGRMVDKLALTIEVDCDGGEWSTYSGAWLNEKSYKKSTLTLDSCYNREYLLKYNVSEFQISKDGRFTQSENITSCSVPWYPELSTYKLSKEALKTIPKDKYRIMRNEIYARHGHTFEDRSLWLHFLNCEWHHPVEKQFESRLNEVEKYNVEILLDAERVK